MDTPTKDEIDLIFKKLKCVPGNKVRFTFYNNTILGMIGMRGAFPRGNTKLPAPFLSNSSCRFLYVSYI